MTVSEPNGEWRGLASVPPWALLGAAGRMSPNHVALLAQTTRPLRDFGLSSALWRALYVSRFSAISFAPSKEPVVDWRNRFANRYHVIANIRRNKARVKSFQGKIDKVRAVGNAFAFSTDTGISIVRYQFSDVACEYQLVQTSPVVSDDFCFDGKTILAVKGARLMRVDLNAPSHITNIPVVVGDHPRLQPVDGETFALVADGACGVYDPRSFGRKCRFEHSPGIHATAARRNTLFVSCRSSLTAHDIRNPTGPIIWNYPHAAGFCYFDLASDRALHGDRVVDLNTGEEVANLEVPDAVRGSIRRNLIVLGRARELVFHELSTSRQWSGEDFFGGETVKAIEVAPNGTVAVAGDWQMRIFGPDGLKVADISGGSIAQRKTGAIPPWQDVVYDGERLIGSCAAFVRVWDFYGRRRGASA